MRFQVPGGFLLLVMLCAGVGACSSQSGSASSPPSSPSPPSSQAPTSARTPAAIDPCTLLTANDVYDAYSTDSAAKRFNLYLLTRTGDYNPSFDQSTLTLSCTWTAPVTTTLGTTTLTVLELFLAPSDKYSNDICETPIDGIGQAACLDSRDGLNVKDGTFYLTIQDAVSPTGDVALEEQLAPEALAILRRTRGS